MVEDLCTCDWDQYGPDDSERAVADIIRCLDGLKERTPHKIDENITFLKTFFETSQISSLFQIYGKLKRRRKFFTNFTPNSEDLLRNIDNILTLSPPMSPEATELTRIFQNPHFKALIAAHDEVISGIFEQDVDNDIEENTDVSGDSVRIVRMLKEDQEPLGITVRHCASKGCCIITRIIDGGTASRSGVLTIGDEIYEINGVSVKESRIEDILTLLHFSINSVSLKVVPALEIIRTFPRENKMFYAKCHFAYNPRHDSLLPCQEAGLAFGKNEILHVFDRTDIWWWQARKEGCRTGQAGLIPSQILQERRLYKANLENALGNKCFSHKKFEHSFSSKTKRRKYKKRKIMYSSNYINDFETTSMLVYEEVIELTPSPDIPRPIVLVGPRFVGRNELRRLLISSDPERFITPVNYSSLKQLDKENNNILCTDPKNCMMTSATLRSLTFEHEGEFERISIESVKTLMDSGKCCVLVIPPQDLTIIRTREFLPYVIFIKPPTLQKLRQTRLMTRVKSSSVQSHNSRVFTVTELQDMIMRAEEIEHKYGHYFDLTIINDDLQDAYDRLYTAAYLVARETQWIPVNWLA